MRRASTLLKTSLAALTLLACQARPSFPEEGPTHPFPQHQLYAPGTVRPDHRSQAQQDDDVRAAYDHWKASYLVPAGTDDQGHPLYRVTHGSGDPWRTVSEGQGYGMIITAIMAGYDPEAKQIFDGLWRFSRMHPSWIDGRLMAWQVPEDPETGVDSAFDGDADMAQGLLLADAQWASDGGLDYTAAADTLLTAILESTIGPQSRLPELGDWVEPDDTDFGQYAPRSSDFMPAHFRTWARYSGDPAWNEVLDATQDAIEYMQDNYSPLAGLLPDFMVPVSAEDHRLRPAPPFHLEGPHDGDYEYNAGRDPWRIGADALLNGDSRSRSQASRMAAWIASATGGDPALIKAGYALDGSPLASGDYFTTFFAAPFGVAAMMDVSHQQFLNDVYDAVYLTYEDYYEDSVTLLCLLLMSGNYWDPTIETAAAPSGWDPQLVRLYPSYPNPFRSATVLRYELPLPALGNMAIFDVTGRRVRVLASRLSGRTGVRSITWDGRDQAGRPLAAGMYFCRLETSGRIAETRLLKVE